MRVGGFSAGGGGVGVGEGVGVDVGGKGDGSGGVGVTVQSGRRDGVGSLMRGGRVRVGVGGSVGVGDVVGVMVAICGRTRAVTASTTAPSSVNSASGGWLIRIQMPHPRPARINNAPIINMLLERAGMILFITLDPILRMMSCQAKWSYGIIVISRF